MTAVPSRDYPSYAPESIDGREILMVLRRRKWLILGSMIAVTSVAAVLILSLPPRYRAEALLLIDPRAAQIVEFRTQTSNLPITADAGVIKTEMGILTSDAISRRVVADLKLYERGEFQKRRGLMTRAQDAVRSAWSYVFGTGTDAAEAVPQQYADLSDPVAIAAEIYRHNVSVRNNESSYLIEVAFDAADPELAKRIVEAHVAAYFGEKSEAKADTHRQASAWLEQQRQVLAGKLRDSVDQVQQFRQKHGMIETGGATIEAQRLSEAGGQLGRAQGELAAAQARLTELKRAMAVPSGIYSVPEVLASPLIERYRSQEAELAGRQAEFVQQYGPRHPKVIEVAAELKRLEGKIGEEVERIGAGLGIKVNEAKTHVAQLQVNYNDMEQRAASVDQAAVNARELEREVAVNQRLYESFLSRDKEMAAEGKLQMPDVRVISPPTLSSAPAQTMLLLGAVSVGSLMIGTALAFLVERMNNRLRSVDDVKPAWGAMGVAGIPLVRTRLRRQFPSDEILDRPTSLYAERVRALGHSLYRSFGDSACSLLITSALPGEGKTSLTLSLARSLGRIGKRVLVIEADFRRPALSRLLPYKDRGADLTDYLCARASLEEALRIDPKSSIHYLAVDRPATVPQDLIESDAMEQLVRGAREVYDFILIDSPPVAAVSDAIVLGRLADAVVFVARWNRTSKSLVNAVLWRLQQDVQLPVRFVLSFVDVNNRSIFSESDFEFYLRKSKHYYLS